MAHTPTIKVNLVLTGLIENEFERDSGGIQLSEISFAEYFQQNKFKDMELTILARGGNKNTRIKRANYTLELFKGTPLAEGGIIETWLFSQQVNCYLINSLFNNKEKKQIIHFTSIGPAINFLTPEFWFFKRKKKISPLICYTIYNFHYAVARRAYDIFRDYFEEWAFLHSAEEKIINKADYVFVPSLSFSKYLEKIFKRRIIFLPNTIGEISKFKTKIKKNNWICDKYILLFSICRLAKEKNLERCIRSFHNILKMRNFFNLKYLIAGEGEEKIKLISLAKKLGLKYFVRKNNDSLRFCFDQLRYKDIIFMGRIKGEEKKIVWNLIDILLLPSLREISPLVGLEALVYGKPIIASNILGWRDLFNVGAEIHLVDPNKEVDLVRVVLSTVKTLPFQKEEISKRQHKIYNENFSPQIVILKRINIYEDIVKKADKRGA